ncbi:AAA family ATPase [Candidatus Saccharibacteria bacterium]|jgi:ribose 1,5-bisphosphokinase PhnN|nr:AAA family ATPase [Candidatus Saccharibacteria bacterium]
MSRRSYVVTGPSGSGKSTLVNRLRDSAPEAELTIPRRVITLPVRPDSDPIENRNVSMGQFKNLLDADEITVWWERRLGPDLHKYGFEKSGTQEAPKTEVFLGNSAMIGSGMEGVRSLIRRSTLVIVTADLDSRGDRIQSRLPGMSGSELDTRLHDLSLASDIVGCKDPRDVVVFDTTSHAVTDSSRMFNNLILNGVVPFGTDDTCALQTD